MALPGPRRRQLHPTRAEATLEATRVKDHHPQPRGLPGRVPLGEGPEEPLETKVLGASLLPPCQVPMAPVLPVPPEHDQRGAGVCVCAAGFLPLSPVRLTQACPPPSSPQGARPAQGTGEFMVSR